MTEYKKILALKYILDKCEYIHEDRDVITVKENSPIYNSLITSVDVVLYCIDLAYKEVTAYQIEYSQEFLYGHTWNYLLMHSGDASAVHLVEEVRVQMHQQFNPG